MKKLILTSVATLIFAAASLQPLSAQLTINDSIPVEDLIMDFFNSGVLISVDNVTVNGQTATDLIHPQFGLFNNGLSDGFEMNSGLLMYTANVLGLMGEYNNPLENYQDADMELMVGNNVNDCAVVEFDVLVDADALAFSYTFGSAEYASFTCSPYNDGFGLFISGPGIDGPYSNNAINIATIPDSDTPVAINTVNRGAPSGSYDATTCLAANPNWQQDTIYYVDNPGNSISSTDFNGFTVSLEAYVEVEFGQVYHMKFAVCNAVDGAFHSGVLLEEGSFEGRLLGTADNPGKAPFKLYPNPARDFVSFQNLDENARTATIIDITGRQVKSIDLSSLTNSTLPIADLETGVYIVEILGANGPLATSKLVKR